MLKQMILVLAAVIGTQASAATVKSARLDAENKYILVEVTYSGGCGSHKFGLALQSCAESFPVQCQAELTHETDDRCEALIGATVVLPLAQYGLTDSYYSNGSMKIKGDLDWKTNMPSSASLRLPAVERN